MSNPFLTQPYNNQLPYVSSVSGGDLIPISSQDAGVFAFVNMATIAAYIQTLLTPVSYFFTQYASPLTGTTVTLNQASTNVFLIVTPAGTIAAATFALPASSVVLDGQVVYIVTTQTVTTATFTASGASLSGAPTTLTAAAPVRFIFNQLFNTWYKI